MTKIYVILTQAGIDHIVNVRLIGFEAGLIDSWRGNNNYFIKGADTGKENKLTYPIQVERQIYNWLWLKPEYFILADEYKIELEQLIKVLGL